MANPGQVPAQPTVLVVDAEPTVQALAAQALRTAGYNVLVAGEPDEAMRVADQYPANINLLLTDVMLPTGRGIALAEQLLDKRPGTPVLYMSGLHTDAMRALQEKSANGPNAQFLPKPFVPRTLVERVERMVGTNTSDASAVAGDSPALVSNVDASYRLESPVKCPQCGETITTLKAVRLLRIQVNFTSTLPRRGRVLVCPECYVLVPGDLTNF
jgi:DNA-binding response OmpR family regulator